MPPTWRSQETAGKRVTAHATKDLDLLTQNLLRRLDESPSVCGVTECKQLAGAVRNRSPEYFEKQLR